LPAATVPCERRKPVQLIEAAQILAAGAAAGAINALVGSGTLVTFPILLALGYPPVVANASNAVGLVPGSFAAAYGYRAEVAAHRRLLLPLGAAALAGGIVGAALLLVLPDATFRAVVPVLISGALVLIVLQPWLVRVLRSRGIRAGAKRPDSEPGTESEAGIDSAAEAVVAGAGAGAGAGAAAAGLDAGTGAAAAGLDAGTGAAAAARASAGAGPSAGAGAGASAGAGAGEDADADPDAGIGAVVGAVPGPGPGDRGPEPAARPAGPALIAGVFAAGVYGGYFGAALGVLLLGLLGVLVSSNLQQVNGLKNILSGAANTVAAVVFIVAGVVSWLPALLIAVSAVIGGMAAARYGRRLPDSVLRAVIVAVGVTAVIRMVS
jgi:uncharacterized membrane protein YfcA